MKKRLITSKMIADFEVELRNDEKSGNTIEKYLRDIRCFSEFSNGRIVEKALVLKYKAYLEKEYALASANSMLAAINSFFKFVGWYDCCVKQFKVQRKTYCSEESELTKQEYSSNKLYQSLSELFDGKSNEQINSLFSKYDCYSNVLGNISDAAKGVDYFLEILKYTASIEAYYNASEEFKSILKEVADVIPSVNTDYGAKFNETYNNYSSCVDYNTIMNNPLPLQKRYLRIVNYKKIQLFENFE